VPIFVPFRLDKKLVQVFWLISILFLILFVGLRSGVGGDWNTYLKIFNAVESFDSLAIIKSFNDPGYFIFMKLSNFLGLGIYGVNLGISIIFFLGLWALLKKSNYKLLFLVISLPYLIYVVSMGYVRQAAALGIIMHLYAYLNSENPKIVKMLFIIFAAVLFHKSAILFLPLILLIYFKTSLFNLVFLIPIFLFSGSILAYQLFLDYFHYASGLVQSSGAFIRQLVMLVPCLIFLRYGKLFSLFYDYKLIRIIVLIVICAFPLVFFASTAVDRALLYFYPIQMIVLTRLPDFIQDQSIKAFYFLTVCLAYFLLLYVWINFSDHSYLWLPYKFIV